MAHTQTRSMIVTQVPKVAVLYEDTMRHQALPRMWVSSEVEPNAGARRTQILGQPHSRTNKRAPRVLTHWSTS